MVKTKKSAVSEEKRLASFPKINPNPVIEVDAGGLVVFANQASRDILREAGLKADLSFFFPRDIKKIISDFRRREKKHFYREIKVGEIIFGENIYFAPAFETARIYATDVSRQKKAEAELKKSNQKLEERVRHRTRKITQYNQELRASKQRYKNLWDNAPVAYHILDNKGVILRVNKTEARMLGYSVREMIGRPIFYFVLPEQRKDARKRFRLKLRGRSLPKKEGRIYVRKDGTKLHVLINDAIDKDDAGEIVRVRTTMFDVTERVRAEEALRKSNELLRKSQEQLTESYKHLGIINRKISLLLDMERQHQGRKKKEIANYILSSAMSLAKADAGLMCRFDRQDEKFRLVAHAGLTDRKQNEARELDSRTCPLLRAAIKEPARAQGHPKALGMGEIPLAGGIKHVLLLPLIKDNKLDGALLLQFLKKQDLEAQELEFFDIFSMHASLALTNAGVIK